jgi:hypothetical protein
MATPYSTARARGSAPLRYRARIRSAESKSNFFRKGCFVWGATVFLLPWAPHKKAKTLRHPKDRTGRACRRSATPTRTPSGPAQGLGPRRARPGEHTKEPSDAVANRVGTPGPVGPRFRKTLSRSGGDNEGRACAPAYGKVWGPGVPGSQRGFRSLPTGVSCGTPEKKRRVPRGVGVPRPGFAPCS